jgi:hypothetical protein
MQLIQAWGRSGSENDEFHAKSGGSQSLTPNFDQKLEIIAPLVLTPP